MYPTQVLVPVDFSDPSVEAARLGLSIAGRRHAGMTLVHVDALPAFSERMAQRVGPEVWGAYLERRNVVVRDRLNALARAIDGEGVRTLVGRYDPADAIVASIAETGADLVVMAPHGAGASERFLLGGVAFEVPSNAPCPVLVTRHRPGALPSDGRFRRPLVLGSEDAPTASLARLVAALVERDASVDLVDVLPTRELLEEAAPSPVGQSFEETRAQVLADLRRAASDFSRQGIRATVRLDTGDVSAWLLQRLVEGENDLVVVPARRPRARAGTLGVVARRLLQHSPVPVVTVPSSGERE